MRKVELLAPAGSMSKLKTAFQYGADAVYLGGKAFNLRAQSHNFSMSALKEAVDYAHSLGKKVYVTLNIIAHNKEIKALPNFVKYLEQIGVDAVIVADLGVMELVQEHSNLRIHVSTQSSSTNYRSVRMWEKLGAKRVVLAREVTLNDIKRIRDQVPDMELEVFVHGSMCMTYSGRCHLSSYMADRDGNRGVCANSCRWKYYVVEEGRPGEYFPIHEDESGTYLFNSKDLCTIDFLDKIIEAGVDGLKIEGRMKSVMYGATTTKIYRAGVDSYFSPEGFRFDPTWRQELETFSHRGYTSGFFIDGLDKENTNRVGGYRHSHDIVGQVTAVEPESTIATVELLNKVEKGTTIEVIKPKGPNVVTTVTSMISVKTGKEIEVGQPNTLVQLEMNVPVEPLDVIRQEVRETMVVPSTTPGMEEDLPMQLATTIEPVLAD